MIESQTDILHFRQHSGIQNQLIFRAFNLERSVRYSVFKPHVLSDAISNQFMDTPNHVSEMPLR